MVYIVFDAIMLTLGFEPGPLVRAIAAYPLSSSGRIIIFTPIYRDERCERAFLDFQRIVNMMFREEHKGNEISIERVHIQLDPLSKGVQEVRKILYDLKDKHVLIALTGGMRALCLAVFIAYLTIPWIKEPKILVYLEGRGKSIEIPPIRKVLDLTIFGLKQEILNLLAKEPRTITQLSIELNRDRSVIYRHISWLESQGLIERKGKLIHTTELGKLFAQPQ